MYGEGLYSRTTQYPNLHGHAMRGAPPTHPVAAPTPRPVLAPRSEIQHPQNRMYDTNPSAHHIPSAPPPTEENTARIQRTARKTKEAAETAWNLIPSNRQGKIKKKLIAAIAKHGAEGAQEIFKKMIGSELPDSFVTEFFTILTQNTLSSAVKSLNNYTAPPQNDSDSFTAEEVDALVQAVRECHASPTQTPRHSVQEDDATSLTKEEISALVQEMQRRDEIQAQAQAQARAAYVAMNGGGHGGMIPSTADSQQTHTYMEGEHTSRIQRVARKTRKVAETAWNLIPGNRQKKIQKRLIAAIANYGKKGAQKIFKAMIGSKLPDSIVTELFIILTQNTLTSLTKSFKNYTAPKENASPSFTKEDVDALIEDVDALVQAARGCDANYTQILRHSAEEDDPTSLTKEEINALVQEMQRHDDRQPYTAMTGGGYGGGMPPSTLHAQQAHPHMMVPHMQMTMHAVPSDGEIIFESAGMTLQSTGMVSPATGQTVYQTNCNNGRTTLYLEATQQRDTQGRPAYINVTRSFNDAMRARSAQAYNNLSNR